MKKVLIPMVVVVFAVTLASAQKAKKYSKLFYNNTEVDGGDVTVSIVSAVATDGELKFKLKIANKTNDYIIFKPKESRYVANGKEVKPNEKEMILGPLENDSKVINIKGSYNSTEKGEYIIEGIYKVSPKGNSIATEDYLLPQAKSEFSTGSFTVTSTKVVKQSDATKLSFSVSYTGDKIGCVFTRKATMLMPDKNEYGPEKPSGMFAQSGMILLQKGKSEDFDLVWERKVGGRAMDMQLVPMTLKWNDTFCDVKPEQQKPLTVPFEINTETSK